ncbi:MAG: hypothetical protein JO316_12630 [Abitibacteriaceae bacterium]|nr:hypothetical protein [Abditibacteriaceae bacterium]MBV9866191.1 hypothetical protein [Abditibacteriaceae bacterium]
MPSFSRRVLWHLLWNILLLYLLPCCLLAQEFTQENAKGAPSVPTGTWLGQDGHDFVGPSATVAGSDVQDIHVALAGLPPEREIAGAVVLREGGGEWDYNGHENHWAAALVRAPHATTADLYLEPSHADTPFITIRLHYGDGTMTELHVAGGKTDPKLRMPGVELAVRWVGQDGQDWVGATPAVGPDGLQDVHLALSHLSTKVELKSLLVQGAGTKWQYGLNPEGYANAELIRHPDDAAQADLFLQPTQDLNGQTLSLTAMYSNISDTTTVPAATCNALLKMPAPKLFKLAPNHITAHWLGQDGKSPKGRGDIHVTLDGLPLERSLAAAVLSDAVGGEWIYRSNDKINIEGNPKDLPLLVERATQSPKAQLYFPPYRNENHTRLTLRLIFDNEETTVMQLDGGPCDPYRRGRAVAATRVVAKPGDDLNELCNRFGTVRLTRGKYLLQQPLVLNQSVMIIAEPGTVVEFSQRAEDSSTWMAAIKINCSHTTLQGFMVRFATPIRWRKDGRFGPAVIGSTDYETSQDDARCNITISGLDIESSPMLPGTPLEEAPRTIRMVTATSGHITHNILKGGVTEVMNGPWEITHNEYHGTVPGTFAYDTFAGHYTHDVLVQDNHLHPLGPHGKTWRFLVLTQQGAHDVVTDNTVEGIGARDDDTLPNPNAPELILTEAYRLHFEGKPAAMAVDGRILQVPMLHMPGVQSGDVVSVLDGPHAGQWHSIAQVINPTTFLMDTPLPPGDYAISIATGFVGEYFGNNTADTRGSSITANLVLAGNHFGPRVVGNHLIGGGEGFRILATPTEAPNIWGWSHAPFLGGVFKNNVIEDYLRGTFDVEHSQYVKSSRGRVYMTVDIANNTFGWSTAFLQKRKQKDPQFQLVAGTIGDSLSLDAGELIVHMHGNHVLKANPVSSSHFVVKAAQVNGRLMREKQFSLP